MDDDARALGFLGPQVVALHGDGVVLAGQLVHLVDEAGGAAGHGFRGGVLRQHGDDHGGLGGAGGQRVRETFQLQHLFRGQGGGVLVVGGGGGDDGAFGRIRHAGVKADHGDAVGRALLELGQNGFGGQGREAQGVRLFDQFAVEGLDLQLDVGLGGRAVVVHFHAVFGRGFLAARAHGLPEGVLLALGDDRDVERLFGHGNRAEHEHQGQDQCKEFLHGFYLLHILFQAPRAQNRRRGNVTS